MNHPKERDATTGREGETFACGYLVEKGFRIIERNARAPWGELDIVAISPDKTLVFVEVKTVTQGNSFGLLPEDEMSAGKIKKFQKAAYLYANAHPELVRDNRGWRLDVVALTKTGTSHHVAHYENI